MSNLSPIGTAALLAGWTVTLSDSEVATLIDALAWCRDRLVSEGMTGRDATGALAKINSIMRPNTYGLTITANNV